MQAYAAYRRLQNIEFYSIRQKKHPNTCVCAIFVVSLQPKEKKNEYNTNTILIIINLIKHNYNYGAYNI